MARHATPHPTERELDLLQVLWEKEPATLREICDELSDKRKVAKTTVATLLKLMEDKGFVERTPDRKWRAVIGQNATKTKFVIGLMDKLFNGSARRLVAHVVNAGSLSPEDVEELIRLLEEAESKPEEKRESS